MQVAGNCFSGYTDDPNNHDPACARRFPSSPTTLPELRRGNNNWSSKVPHETGPFKFSIPRHIQEHSIKVHTKNQYEEPKFFYSPGINGWDKVTRKQNSSCITRSFAVFRKRHCCGQSLKILVCNYIKHTRGITPNVSCIARIRQIHIGIVYYDKSQPMEHCQVGLCPWH